MNHKIGDVEDLEARPPAPTLYQAIEEKGKYLGRSERYHLIFPDTKMLQVNLFMKCLNARKAYFESLLMQFKSPDQITGLLMIYPYHVVNIIETSFRTMVRILRALSESEKVINCYINYHTEQINKDLSEGEEPRRFVGFDRDMIENMDNRPKLAPLIHNRLLYIKDNIVNRVFRTYEVLTFDMEPISLNQYDSSEPDEKKLLETLNQLLRLTIYLSEEPMKNQEEYVPEIFKMKLTEILKNLREKHPELVPQQVTVGYFADLCKFDGIIPIQEYLNFYDLPYETSLQSETTWPLPKKSFLYT